MLKKLNVVGTALYVAAHPDDENTVLLAYLAKERMVRAAYLSITRGDGGQNLIGSEQAERMGVIRTQELLQARQTDGAEQFFTRANDFGFSKSTEEALKIWGREKVLSDVVWTIRKLKPDVIITRFPKTSQAGHGHHSASAVLAEEAFAAAADPGRFPEQLPFVQPWQVKRIVWNSYQPNFTAGAPKEKDYVTANVGAYNPLVGKSYTEIAGESRSMHKSQGFGTARNRGNRVEYLRHTAGKPATQDLFDDVDLTWNRVPGSEAVSQTLQQAYETFKPENPAASLPLLLQAYNQLQQLPKDNHWINVKQNELTEAIAACAGLWYEANALTYASTPGDSVRVNVSAVNRSDFPVTWTNIRFNGARCDTVMQFPLKNNELKNFPFRLQLPNDLPYTQPYWLREPHEQGMYTVNDRQLIGLPEAPPVFAATFTFQLNGTSFQFTKPVNYKWTDPVEGEQYRPFEIRPPVMANLTENVYVFPGNQPKDVQVLLKAGKDNVQGEVRLALPATWKIEPQPIPFSFKNNEEETRVTFRVTPPAQAVADSLQVLVRTSSGQEISQGMVSINYRHIPVQTLFPAAVAKAVRLEIATAGTHIGYLMGAGDDVPAALRQVGYRVTPLTEDDFRQAEALNQYDAIVLGIRAYNTVERIKFYQPKLLAYVQNGGTVVAQYATERGLAINQIGPYFLRLSRERVTVEEAPVKFLQPTHPLLNTPNKITKTDFAHWIQERGLYFADSLDTHYQTILSSHDPGEKPQPGGLVVADYGKGRFIYTGYAFFRQLPAGVPGAYRLFANLLARRREAGSGND